MVSGNMLSILLNSERKTAEFEGNLTREQYFALEDAFRQVQLWEERTRYVTGNSEYTRLLPEVEKARAEHFDWYEEYQMQKHT